MLFLTASCAAMHEPQQFKTVTLKKEYTNDPHNPIPSLLNEKRVQEYCHWYAIEAQLPLKKSNEYAQQFEKSIIKGGQKTYDIFTKKNSPSYNETPKEYLQDMTAVICFLYSQLLSKNRAECGPKKWSLILDDQEGLWRNFFINEYLRVTQSRKEYIASITTSHLVNLNLRTQYGITTDIEPESIKPFFLPNNDDTILIIPNHEKKWLFLKTGKNSKTGWITGSLMSGLNWVRSQLRKNHILQSNDNPTYSKEYIPHSITTKMGELFSEICQKNPEKVSTINDIYAILKSKTKEDFGTEKNEAIKNFIYEVESAYDHLDMRLGNEGIFDNDELRSTSVAYSLLEYDKEHYKITESYALYYPIISLLSKLKHLIFLHNHVSKETYSMQTIRNAAKEITELKSKLDGKMPDLHVEDYCISIINLLKLILTSQEGDV
jgi:hypothetical protein